MSDQCANCGVRGNTRECRQTVCSFHESWYVQCLESENARLRAEIIEFAKTVRNWMQEYLAVHDVEEKP